MSTKPISIIYTDDGVLLQRIRGYLHARAELRHVSNDPGELELLLHQHSDTFLFMDLRGADCRTLLPRLVKKFPHTIVVALGAQRSDPGLRAAAAGVYAVEPAEIDRLRLQTLFDQAQAHLWLQRENRVLKESLRQSFLQHAAPTLWSRMRERTHERTILESTCSEGRADWVWCRKDGRRQPEGDDDAADR